LKDARIQELEDQVRDLMFFIEAQKKIQTTEVENGQVLKIKESDITAPENPNEKKKTTPKKKAGRGRGARR